MKKSWGLLALLVGAGTAQAAPQMVKGRVGGFTDIRSDDTIDGALVFPALSAGALLNFDLEALLGPDEEISIGPAKAKVPSNFYFPRQTESYFLLPVTLSKEWFTVFLEPVEQELGVLSFKLPFAKTVDLARAQAPFTEIMSHLRLHRFGVGPSRDWTQDGMNSYLHINNALWKNVGFRWDRPATRKDDFDLVMAFQKTPFGAWFPTDIAAKAPAQGSLSSGEGMQPFLKVLMMRLRVNGNQTQSAVGHIVSVAPGEVVQATGLPAMLSGAKVEGTMVSWNPITDKNGWMAILRGRPRLALASELEAFPRLLNFGFNNSPLSTVQAWVMPSEGRFPLSAPLADGEKITLLFVQTSREVPSPALEGNVAEPALFTYAEHLSMVRVP